MIKIVEDFKTRYRTALVMTGIKTSCLILRGLLPPGDQRETTRQILDTTQHQICRAWKKPSLLRGLSPGLLWNSSIGVERHHRLECII